jgi:hypothetical protein
VPPPPPPPGGGLTGSVGQAVMENPITAAITIIVIVLNKFFIKNLF